MSARLARHVGFAALLVAASGSHARADDERLVLMHEPTPFTDVLDASDDGDVFDLNAHIGYVRTVDSGVIKREHTTQAGERRRSTVADSRHLRSQLMFGLDVGLYKDVMAFLRLPLVLSDERSIGVPEGRSRADVTSQLQDPGDFAGRSGELFGLPLDSPARAGFDYVGVGASAAITSQERRPWLPTWVVLVEGRRAVGKLIRPCRLDDSGRTSCGADNGEDLDGNALSDGTSRLADNTGAGRGVSALNLETRVSKRFRYFEPYAGLGALLEWASSAKKYFQPGGALKGYTDMQPSRQFSATLGTEYIPWEHRGRYQRVALDLRMVGTYLTRGRDYSILYDALGTSGHAALARPTFEGVQGAAPEGASLHACEGASDESCYVGRASAFYGLTNLSSRLKYGARIGLDIRAARYIRFAFGSGVSFVTGHSLTGAAACNSDVDDPSRSQFASGQSCGGNALNPAYRGTIDAPGRRFWMTQELIFELYASAMAQF